MTAYPAAMGDLDVAALAEALGWAPDEHVQLAVMSTMPPQVAAELGCDEWFTRFTSRVHPVDKLVASPSRSIGHALNWWFGPCPVDPEFRAKRPPVKDRDTGQLRPARGRPNKHEITRLSSVWADLDFKHVNAGGCGDCATAEKVIYTISEWVGALPAVTIASGHGLQPLWRIEDGGIGEKFTTASAGALLARFGELVAAAAKVHGAGVDSVFEAARVLRMPGSINHKLPLEPVPATIVPELSGGGALSVSELSDRLDEREIPEAPRHRARGSAASIGPVVSAPGDWRWAETTCSYTAKMIEGWAKGKVAGGRHPWMVAQLVRLACAHRAGCLTEADYRRGLAVIGTRFEQLLATVGDPRSAGPGEVESAQSWAVALAAAQSNDEIATELGGFGRRNSKHTHGPRSGGIGRESAAAGSTASRGGGDAMNHIELAERMGQEYGGQLIHAAGFGWFCWDGRRWALDEGSKAAIRDAEAVVAEHGIHPRTGAGGKASDVKGVLTLSAADPGLTVPAAMLDADPYLLNTPGGVLDLRTLQVGPHDPGLLQTKITRGSWQPGNGYAGTRFASFIEQMLPTAAVRVFMQRCAGVALVGTLLGHDLPTLIGSSGKNGKSTLAEALVFAMGDYAILGASDLLMEVPGGNHTTSETDLRGVRFVVCSESNDGARMDAAKMKRLTGDRRQKARRMRQDNAEWDTSHHLWLITNNPPRVSSQDDAVWRRIKAVPFDVEIPSDQVDLMLPTALQLEADALLAWAIEGWASLPATRLAPVPAEVRAASLAYRNSADQLGAFLGDCTRPTGAPADRIRCRWLHMRWRMWCVENGIDERGQLGLYAFSNQIGRKHRRVEDRNGAPYFTGLLGICDHLGCSQPVANAEFGCADHPRPQKRPAGESWFA